MCSKKKSLFTNLDQWREKDSISTMHLRPMPSHEGRTLGIDGDVGDGGGLEGWRRSALELDHERVREPMVR